MLKISKWQIWNNNKICLMRPWPVRSEPVVHKQGQDLTPYACPSRTLYSWQQLQCVDLNIFNEPVKKRVCFQFCFLYSSTKIVLERKTHLSLFLSCAFQVHSVHVYPGSGRNVLFSVVFHLYSSHSLQPIALFQELVNRTLGSQICLCKNW